MGNDEPGERRWRKVVRMKGYDYSQPGHYFITVCTEQRLRLFGTVRDAETVHNEIGEMVCQVWDSLPKSFPGIELDAMILMPDHLHGVITLGCDPGVEAAPQLGDVVRYFKGRSTTLYIKGVRSQSWPRVPERLWQRRYNDRIVRNQRELETIRSYIESNPQRWEQRLSATND